MVINGDLMVINGDLMVITDGLMVIDMVIWWWLMVSLMVMIQNGGIADYC